MLGAILLQACHSPSKILDKAGVKNEDCKALILTLQKKVYPLGDDEFYGFRFDSEKLSERAKEYIDLSEKVLFTLTRENECIKGLSKDDIIKLFGKLPIPFNEKYHSEYVYLIKLGKNCPDEYPSPNFGRYGQCDLLRFVFDRQGYLQEVNFLASTVGWYNGYD